MAGFQLTLYGRIWVTPKGGGSPHPLVERALLQTQLELRWSPATSQTVEKGLISI
jgi:hypothetical protein